MTETDWALTISLLSFFVALLALGWSIWSHFIYPKPKVRAQLTHQALVSNGGITGHAACINITNYGPNAVILTSVIGYFFRKFLWKGHFLHPRQDFQILVTERIDQAILAKTSAQMGIWTGSELAAGQQVRLYFPETSDLFKDDVGEFSIGVADSFGRYHRCHPKTVKTAIKSIRKEKA